MKHCCRRCVALALTLLALGLSGCAGLWPGVPPPPPPEAPEAATPPVPPLPARPALPPAPANARPRVERIASGPPNHVYEVRGEVYVPDHADLPWLEVGLASWYGAPFHGRPTASGERYDMNAMTAAHRTMPLPSYARVRNLSNGREVIVRINDRGPFYPGRVIDLSRAAARRLRIDGLQRVEVRRITHEEIRRGSWPQGAGAAAPAADRVR